MLRSCFSMLLSYVASGRFGHDILVSLVSLILAFLVCPPFLNLQDAKLEIPRLWACQLSPSLFDFSFLANSDFCAICGI